MKRLFSTLLLVLSLSSFNPLFSQGKALDKLDANFLNWYNKDKAKDGTSGTSVDKVYAELINGKTPKKVVTVAIIDSGVDIDHEDLDGRIWINTDEIPDNGIDDDQNGYVDDVHGWNFLGNPSGENLHYENMEYTRVYKAYHEQYSSNSTDNPEDLTFKNYLSAKYLYEKEYVKRKDEMKGIEKFEKYFLTSIEIIRVETGIEINGPKDLEQVKPESKRCKAAKDFLSERFDMGFTYEILEELKKRNDDFLNHYLNTEFSPRQIVGDNPLDINDQAYGNNDVTGPDASHGTGVAGVVAAIRNNNVGINGISESVKIMSIRSTPDGDERDKDVALAIRYAVDNGADIINMSFGKDISPQKEFVDKAVKYAEEKGVLLIHAAGNDGHNIDENENYPNDIMLDQSKVSNWITIGANTSTFDKDLAAIFSNYGKEQVDLFAPGNDLITLDIESTYELQSGTSFAAPVVAGIAALILSYYPETTPQEMIELLMDSATRSSKLKVLIPDLESEKREKVKFKELSQSGGIVNAFDAMKMAKKAQ